VGAQVAARFAELLAAPAIGPTPAQRALVALPGELLGDRPREVAPAAPARVPGRRRRPLARGEVYDVAMFWKQNDSGIYGRRQDMVLEYLRRSDRVGTIVHFDAPISPEALVKTYRGGRGEASDQSTLVVRQTVERILRRRDEPGVKRRTFVHAGSSTARLRLPARRAFVDHVRRTLEREGLGRRPLVLWTFPTNPDLPGLIDAIDPEVVVADVVDDNRTWYEPGEPGWDRVEANYREVLRRADVVLANCEPVAEAMAEFAPEVHVVPNGLELPDGSAPGPRPRELADVTGPVIAYVGNLSARLDLDLLDGLARARPGWTFAFVGSAHLDRSILALDAHPNVRFLGVRPYAEVQRLLRHVDVALIPHLDNEMTRAMNPLKAFVYASAGVPVVATPVANLVDLGDLIAVAKDLDGFVAAIEAALAAGRPTPDRALLAPHSWDERIRLALDLVDEAMGGREA
jgi:glycosyltransferase involved in cell wall biosynthesis